MNESAADAFTVSPAAIVFEAKSLIGSIPPAPAVDKAVVGIIGHVSGTVQAEI